MAPDVERTARTALNPTLLTTDVIELTLLLKSLGFRLESIDYDEFRSWNKKSNESGNGNNGTTSATTAHSVRPDAELHFINVEISCSKSKIVSHLSLKINDSETVASDTHTHPITEPAILIGCTCPKRQQRNDNNSFWEVQSSGTFANKRRSINAVLNSEAGIDHDTSSNLLPALSSKSIAMTHVLMQVLLNQYKNNDQFGDANVKEIDIRSIMQAIKRSYPVPMANDKVGQLPSVSQVEDLNLITPLSSMDVTPNEQEGLMNVTIPKIAVNDRTSDDFSGRITALNETVNTEAFSSPKSDLVTSSPHAGNISLLTNERDTSVINLLNRARHAIDQPMLSMRLNVTRNLSQEMLTPSSTSTRDDNIPKRFTVAQPLRKLNERNATQISSNARPPLSTLNRRASVGSVASKLPPRSTTPAAITSRLNVIKPNSSDRPVAAVASKVSLVRRAGYW